MYTVIRKLEISAAHRVNFANGSKCENLHGHNWKITVHMKSEKLNSDGMVYDFSLIKDIVKKNLDHKNLNEIIPQPTAEHIAEYICNLLGEKCFKVVVEETGNNIAIYERF